jgi:ribosomal protein S17E
LWLESRARASTQIRRIIAPALPTFLLSSDNPTNPTATAPSHDNLFSQLTQQVAKMGRVRTKTVKKSAKVIIERYYPKLSLDFETNKRICDEIAIIASKRLRNKIAGYTTHLYVPTRRAAAMVVRDWVLEGLEWLAQKSIKQCLCACSWVLQRNGHPTARAEALTEQCVSLLLTPD